VALAAGLRVIERAQAVADAFHFIKLCLVSLVRGLVHHPVALAVESGGRF
jgi:hypothetical protein